MDFIIDSVETLDNISNRPTKVSKTFSDVYEAAKNLRFTKDSYDRSHWQIRNIGASEEYNKAIIEIAQIACAKIPLNGQLTPQSLLESIYDSKEIFQNMQELVNQEVQIMLTEIDSNNRKTLEVVNRYFDIGFIDKDQFLSLQKDCSQSRKAMYVNNPKIIIELVNDFNKLQTKLMVVEDSQGIQYLRIGKYIEDVIHTYNGEQYDLPEQVKFKDIPSIIGIGIELNIDYSKDSLSNVYKLEYNADGNLESVEKCRL